MYQSPQFVKTALASVDQYISYVQNLHCEQNNVLWCKHTHTHFTFDNKQTNITTIEMSLFDHKDRSTTLIDNDLDNAQQTLASIIKNGHTTNDDDDVAINDGINAILHNVNNVLVLGAMVLICLI